MAASAAPRLARMRKRPVRQRDLEIKSLETMISSNERIMNKIKGDAERMDMEKEEAIHTAEQKIQKLGEANRTSEMQVAGFEKAFMKTVNAVLYSAYKH